jgi:hypothetical protein
MCECSLIQSPRVVLAYQEDGWPHLVQNHISWHLCQDVANEEDADDGIVLGTDKANIVLEATKTSGSDIIPVKVVQHIYRQINQLVCSQNMGWASLASTSTYIETSLKASCDDRLAVGVPSPWSGGLQ